MEEDKKINTYDEKKSTGKVSSIIGLLVFALLIFAAWNNPSKADFMAYAYKQTMFGNDSPALESAVTGEVKSQNFFLFTIFTSYEKNELYFHLGIMGKFISF